MNLLTAAGRIGKDGELRYTSNETPVLGFTLATDVGYGDKKHTLWLKCSIWGKRAEALADYIKKGTPATVWGEADLDTWQGNDGPRTDITVKVDEIALQGGERQDSPPAQQAGNEPAGNGFRDDDPDTLPF